MNACNTCPQRTQAKLCARANELGIGATWCDDLPDGYLVDASRIDQHCENINHGFMQSQDMRDAYLRRIAIDDGRCVALAVLNTTKGHRNA